MTIERTVRSYLGTADREDSEVHINSVKQWLASGQTNRSVSIRPKQLTLNEALQTINAALNEGSES